MHDLPHPHSSIRSHVKYAVQKCMVPIGKSITLTWTWNASGAALVQWDRSKEPKSPKLQINRPVFAEELTKSIEFGMRLDWTLLVTITMRWTYTYQRSNYCRLTAKETGHDWCVKNQQLTLRSCVLKNPMHQCSIEIAVMKFLIDTMLFQQCSTSKCCGGVKIGKTMIRWNLHPTT